LRSSPAQSSSSWARRTVGRRCHSWYPSPISWGPQQSTDSSMELDTSNWRTARTAQGRSLTGPLISLPRLYINNGKGVKVSELLYSLFA
ncbi:hypothetical protein FOZ63_022209, partial [Perkinsus olseni]